MPDEQLFDRITLHPQVMVGKPVIQGTRLTVEYVLNLLAHGATATEIMAEYDGLSQEDIQAGLDHAIGHFKAPFSFLLFL